MSLKTSRLLLSLKHPKLNYLFSSHPFYLMSGIWMSVESSFIHSIACRRGLSLLHSFSPPLCSVSQENLLALLICRHVVIQPLVTTSANPSHHHLLPGLLQQLHSSAAWAILWCHSSLWLCSTQNLHPLILRWKGSIMTSKVCRISRPPPLAADTLASYCFWASGWPPPLVPAVSASNALSCKWNGLCLLQYIVGENEMYAERRYYFIY